MNFSGARIAWIIRGALVVGAVVLVLATLESRPGAEQTLPTPSTAPPVEPTPAITTVSAPRPIATTAPFIERIISRIARASPAPFATATVAPDGLTIVNIVDFAYMPSHVHIHAGQTVAWRNDGRESHDVTGDEDWHSGPIEAPAQYRHTFGYAGTFTYRCSVHLDMRGTIVVVE